MACVLRAFGSDFDPDEFLKGSPLSPSKVWRKGEPRVSIGRSRSRVQDTSGMNVTVSDANVGDFQEQVRDAIGFLHSNKGELARLVAFPGIEEIVLDFAASWGKDVVTQTDYLPPELIRLAGELGLGIEISHYPISDETKLSAGGQ